MSCASPGATHHAACDCREAAWAKRLAASEGRNRRLEDKLHTVSNAFLRMRKKRPDGSVIGTTWPLREAEIDQFFAALAVAEAALAPPPGDEKRGGNDE